MTATAPATTTRNMPAVQQQNALANVNERTVLPIPQLRQLVGAKIDIVRDALPEKMKGAAPRFVIALVTACQQTPKLAECTALSLFGGLVKAANLGLEFGGECWLIPRKGVAHFQIGWKGVVALLYRNPRVSRVAADIVREGDEFDLLNGTESRIVHKYGKARGAATHYYAVIKLQGGESVHKVMSVAEVDAHRIKFSEFGKGPNGERRGTWADNFDAMALKTTIILGSKTAPKSVELPDAAFSEEVQVDGVDLLPAGAVQPRPGELPQGNAETVTVEAVAKLVAEVAQAESSSADLILGDICEKFQVPSLDDLTAPQLAEVHRDLTVQLKIAEGIEK